jgi:hypothetical protein
MADKQATLEVAKVLAPVCFSQFNQQRDAAAKLMGDQKPLCTGLLHRKMPGSDKMAKGVSQACAELLTKVAS